MVEDMHRKSAVGMTEVKVEAGLHQGSAQSPVLFAAGSDRLADEARQECPWTVLFADDMVVCERTGRHWPQKKRNGGQSEQEERNMGGTSKSRSPQGRARTSSRTFDFSWGRLNMISFYHPYH